jgi:hypothetical protein
MLSSREVSLTTRSQLQGASVGACVAQVIYRMTTDASAEILTLINFPREQDRESLANSLRRVVAKQIVLFLFTLTILAGCLVMVPGHLYPVQGSLSAQTPVPIYNVTLSNVLSSGTMSATLQGGEVCSGHWAPVRQNDPSANKLSAEWDRVYGEGFFVANILGTLSSPVQSLPGPRARP